MDGPGILGFSMEALPKLIEQVLREAELEDDDIDLYLMHQATKKLLTQLREHLSVDEKRFPIELEHVGNTVSCTLPILIDQLRNDGRLSCGKKSILVGFGVGLSWAGCAWTESVDSKR